MPVPWKSPYENLDKANRFTLSVDVDLTDHRIIKSIACTHGTVSKFIQTLYHDIAEYARANNLSVLDSDAFINYLRQRADSRLAASAGPRDGRESNTGVRQDASYGSNQSPSLHKTAKGGQRVRKSA